ncbi:MAG: hypothetical protein ACLVI9_03555 [Anaerostipes hadrus]
MAVIKEELGYKEVRMPTKFKTLSDLLTENDIQCIKRLMTGEMLSDSQHRF